MAVIAINNFIACDIINKGVTRVAPKSLFPYRLSRSLIRSYQLSEIGMSNQITQEVLRELLHYDPETGVFTWKPRDRKWFKSDRTCNSWNARFSLKQAGHQHIYKEATPYLRIKLFKKSVPAHVVAWKYMYGDSPLMIDHINGNSFDNRIVNLRNVNALENSRNAKRRTDNASGVTGVSWNNRDKRWYAIIHDNKKRVHIGCFVEIEDAILARKIAEKRFGYHENHGRSFKS